MMKITTFNSAGFVFVMLMVLLCSLLCGPPYARADLVLSGTTPANSFVDVGAQGFGNAPRLLTLQNGNGPDESGQIVLSPGGVPSSAAFAGANNVANPQPPSDKNSVPSLALLGWTSGADVVIGFNSDQSGTGITINQLVLTLYNDSNLPVGTFSLASPIAFSAADLGLQQGNGNSVFDFILTPAEQTTFNNLLVGPNTGNFHIALASALTGINDGPDSFLAVPGPNAPPPVPEPATMLLLGSGLAGLVGLRRKFKA